MTRITLLLVIAFLASCGGDSGMTGAPDRELPKRDADGTPENVVASFWQHDLVSLTYALRVLRAHGIETEVAGSLGVSISVSPSRAAEAKDLLAGFGSIRQFVRGATEAVPEPIAWQELVLDAGMDDAMQMTTGSLEVREVLTKASKEDWVLAKYPIVDRVRWRLREFVHDDLSPATAIEALVVLKKNRGAVRPQLTRKVHVSVFPDH
jgi:hypothetical protein